MEIKNRFNKGDKVIIKKELENYKNQFVIISEKEIEIIQVIFGKKESISYGIRSSNDLKIYYYNEEDLFFLKDYKDFIKKEKKRKTEDLKNFYCGLEKELEKLILKNTKD